MCVMKKIWTKYLIKLGWIKWLSGRANRLLLAVSLLAGSSLAFLPANLKFTYTINGQTVVRRSELGPLTGTVYTYGHVKNVNLVGSELTMETGLLYTTPFIYTVNGITIVRRSELGPLTDHTSNDPTPHLPGHDYGVLGNSPEFAITLPPELPFSYKVHEELVVRRSELGPLNSPVYTILAAQ
jgi:hypothetical protein